MEPPHKEIVEAVRDYTMTSPQRVTALCDAVEYVQSQNIPGDFVECGVWRGGSVMAMLHVLKNRGLNAPGETPRDVHLFDTFEGMSAPTDADRDPAGRTAAELLEAEKDDKAGSANWAYCSQEDVERNVATVGYPAERLHIVRGKVEDTIPDAAPESISLLRLDTDWYESTAHEMEHLFPRLAPGGVLILDDYGHWEGARRAVDEYLQQHGVRLFLQRVDYTGRMAVKQG
ncbi:TylF/MycF/NovP-related O-methyltransferase [Alienimonas chondri]|uniref:8-demethyl-8-(2, 3-dimethoxy-alpha-L-rhamnosyl)-tetracenomycin-C 4'-O-methyltransferase n=1 Tax=Alienimonas chondri TaxID=2681879 RepID=A0ABX1VGM2_9PLAN|nr:TylF/MycF/NovP-related O-methyltransferase [Alienimonas chondri]NNJ26601.1 8-demethyl-8-(2,3-dimethoxy-alpha-L-rhamnosyl)-tetracenomycin-C 4'-O-methyltransferase [Alienimonas chondri]